MLSGCASRAVSEKAVTAKEEQVYIDMKLAFSVVVPAPWRRQRIPTSSPDYQRNRVSWKLPGPKGTENSFQVWALPPRAPVDALADHLTQEPELTRSETETINSPFGPALSVAGADAHQRVLYIAIRSNQSTHILAFRLDPAAYENSEPAIENVIESFRSLP